MIDKDRGKKEYEIAFLVKDSGGASIVEKLLNDYGAEIIFRGELKETVFAYPIKKHRQGHFGFFHFKSDPENLEKMSDALKLKPEVLRVLVIVYPAKKEGKKHVPRSISEVKYPKVKEVEPVSIGSANGGVLTNEALEEKLEEILK